MRHEINGDGINLRAELQQWNPIKRLEAFLCFCRMTFCRFVDHVLRRY